jgi:hypothetical protein
MACFFFFLRNLFFDIWRILCDWKFINFQYLMNNLCVWPTCLIEEKKKTAKKHKKFYFKKKKKK